MTPPPRLLFLARRPPYGTGLAREALDAVLAASAFELPVTVIFDGDGVWQLVRDQDPTGIEEKCHGAQLEALPLFDVEDLRVHAPSLAARGLTAADLLLDATPIDDAGLREAIAQADRILSF
ncbi:MAG: sulfurtransferase complex subunit TusC [Pseudomonadales bacterium]|nr:sulfurtransferase complex subunit TusC [Pseudomonadales bacterium]